MVACLSQGPSAYLQALARRNAAVYVTACAPQAILLTGSTASDTADFFSDIDMIAYYADALPADEQLQAVRADIGANVFREPYARWDGHTCGETYEVRGVECQVGHKVIADLEERTLSLLDGHDPGSLGIKAIIGLKSGIPLYGDDLIRAWQARINDFSEKLARGMVEHYLRQLFPVWYCAEAIEQRDCATWLHQTLAETVLNVLGILAGLNRQYYVPFQFKRTRAFVDGLAIVPDDLANRLDRVFVTDLSGGIAQVERLVGETLTLVHVHMPNVDTSILRHAPGERQQPWRPDWQDNCTRWSGKLR
jgi:hypothetical protein